MLKYHTKKAFFSLILLILTSITPPSPTISQLKTNTEVKSLYSPNLQFSLVVTVLYPNGGEILSGQANITWSVDDPSAEMAYSIEYSSNNGATWAHLTEGISTLEITTVLWDTTQRIDGKYYLLRVTVVSTNGIGTDISDGVFTIENYADKISKPLDPKDNNTFEISTTITVALDVNESVYVEIEYIQEVPVLIPPELNPLGIYLNITLESPKALTELTISVSTLELGDHDPENVGIYRYDNDTRNWQKLKKTGWDAGRNVIWGETDHLTLFGVMDEQAEPPLTPEELLTIIGGGGVIILIIYVIVRMLYRTIKRDRKSDWRRKY